MTVRLPAFAVLSVAVFLSAADLRRDPGWHDFRATCSALQDVDRGNPRLAYARTPERRFPLTYPPLAVTPLKPLCASEPVQRTAWVLVILSATAVLVFAFPALPRILVVALALTGFRAATWIMWTGNVAALEFLFVSLAALGLARRKEMAAGFGLGMAGFVKILPLTFAPVIALGMSTHRRAMAHLASAIGAFAALHVISVTVLPDASLAYWEGLSSGFGGTIAAEAWFGSTTHPSMYSAALAIGRRFPATFPVAAGVYVAVAVLLVVCFVIASRRTSDRHHLAWTAMVLVLLLSPRLKPYTLALALPSACAAVSRLRVGGQVAALFALSVMPFAAFAATGLEGRAYVAGYAQLLALAGLYTVLIAQACRPGYSCGRRD